MWGGAEEGKMRRRILICWGFWPQRDVLSAGAGGGRKGEHVWRNLGGTTGTLFFSLSRFMVGHLN